jgi:hypothetical protein
MREVVDINMTAKLHDIAIRRAGLATQIGGANMALGGSPPVLATRTTREYFFGGTDSKQNRFNQSLGLPNLRIVEAFRAINQG